MSLPKQKKNESDADYAVRLEKAKEAARKYSRERYHANKEAISEQRRKFYQANKEAISEQRRKFYQANKEAISEYNRKWREANKEAMKEYKRKYREANREAINERNRKWQEAKTLANAKGKPLRPDFRRSNRPKLLSRLIVKVAEDFCRNYGFPLESKFDTDILRHAAETIRNSPELYGAANPWHGTDYLCSTLVNRKDWAQGLRKNWRNKL